MRRPSSLLFLVLGVVGCSTPSTPPVEPPAVEPLAPEVEASGTSDQSALARCEPDHGFEEHPQLCTELSRHQVEAGDQTYLIVWRQRDYEGEWGDQSAAFPLGLEVLVLTGEGALVDSTFVENLSGAGFRDVLEVEPAEPREATIAIWCRGYYPDPHDESSYVEPGECGATQVLVELDGAGVEILVVDRP